jgi:predicted transcriptional regulator
MPAGERCVEDLERAVRLLGSLEGRIMRAVWSGQVPEVFVVRHVRALMPELAYTTVMTTLRRLADKGLLEVGVATGQRAHEYRSAGDPLRFLAEAGARAAAEVVDRYGEAAISAFAARLTSEQRRRLEDLAGQEEPA